MFRDTVSQESQPVWLRLDWFSRLCRQSIRAFYSLKSLYYVILYYMYCVILYCIYRPSYPGNGRPMQVFHNAEEGTTVWEEPSGSARIIDMYSLRTDLERQAL